MAVLVVLSATLGWRYWMAQNQEQIAYITVAAEVISFSGLSLARSHWRADKMLGFGAFALTLMAALWCGLTMFQKIDADTQARALETARESPAYIFAQRSLTEASASLSTQLGRQPPTCTCPDTIAAWEASQTASVSRLRGERDAALSRLAAATPAAQVDWGAVARGAGVELMKLFGFMVFGLAVAPVRRPRQPFEVLEGGRAPANSAATRPDARPSRAGQSLLAGVVTWWALQSQQAQADTPPPAPTEPQPKPVEHMGDLVSDEQISKEVARLAAHDMGERAIAASVSARSGRFVSRWQVRKMLGRVAA